MLSVSKLLRKYSLWSSFLFPFLGGQNKDLSLTSDFSEVTLFSFLFVSAFLDMLFLKYIISV